MSSCVLGIAVAVMLAVGTVPVARAQTVTQQRARVAALATELRTLMGRLDSIERTTDTIDVEGVRFVVRPQVRSQAEQAARLALAELDRGLGSEDRHLLDGWVSTDLERGWPASGGLQGAVANVVRAAGAQRLRDLGGSALFQWGGWWEPEERDLEWAYLNLITLPAIGATKCFEGDMQACAALLGLTPVSDGWDELFDEAGRRTWVANHSFWFRSTGGMRSNGQAAQFRQCVDAKDDRACLDLLHARWGASPPLPSQLTKRSVVFVARSLGGDGTFSRLVADTTAPLADRLSAAAGVSVDSLLRAWHARLLEAAPAPTRVGPVAGWTSFLVVVLAGALAMRSTRWRLG